MVNVFGWIAWAAVALAAVSWAVGCRAYMKADLGLTRITVLQTLFWWVLAAVFLFGGIPKLHLIWLAPLGFFLARPLALGFVPVLSPVAIAAARLFLGVLLIGTGRRIATPNNAR